MDFSSHICSTYETTLLLLLVLLLLLYLMLQPLVSPSLFNAFQLDWCHKRLSASPSSFIQAWDWHRQSAISGGLLGLDLISGIVTPRKAKVDDDSRSGCYEDSTMYCLSTILYCIVLYRSLVSYFHCIV